jgi:hypothetical protein
MVGSDEAVAEVGEQVVGTEVRTAIIRGETFDERAVQYTVVDGRAMFEGDIILGLDEDLQRRTEEIQAEAARHAQGVGSEAAPGDAVDPAAGPGRIPEGAVVITGQGMRWPGGVVPFELDASLTAAAQTAVTNAIAHWHDVTRLAFRARQAADAQWLTFHDANECSSWVGRQGGAQQVNIAAGCGRGATIHEIGHSVGLWHEQSREDRDQFVTILWQNIQAGQSHNFDQHVSDGDDIGPYDYGSIMHYGGTDFGTVNPATGATNTTIVPTQPLPAGVTMGQRSGLSSGDRGAVAWMYAPIYPGPSNVWLGRFLGQPGTDALYYSPARGHWYLGATQAGMLTWRDVGDTTGFGDLADGRPFWTGDFNGNGSTDVLFYYPGDDNWWLGTVQPGNGQLTWIFAGNTAGFGHAINDGRPFWIGDFNGDGRADVLFYYPGDDNWWLGSLQQVSGEDPSCAHLRAEISGQEGSIRALQEELVGLDPRNPGDRAEIREIRHQITALRQQITAEQGQMATLGCPVTPNPGGWQLSWTFVGNTAGFGHAINDGRPFWVGDFDGSGSTDVLFHYRGDLNWWRGSIGGGSLAWTLAANW